MAEEFAKIYVEDNDLNRIQENIRVAFETLIVEVNAMKDELEQLKLREDA